MDPVDWQRLIMDSTTLAENYDGPCGTGRDLRWNIWPWQKVMMDPTTLAENYDGPCGTGRDLRWTLWPWQRVMMDPVILSETCDGPCDPERLMMNSLVLAETYDGPYDPGGKLWWTLWLWKRLMMVPESLAEIYNRPYNPGRDFSARISVLPSQCHLTDAWYLSSTVCYSYQQKEKQSFGNVRNFTLNISL